MSEHCEHAKSDDNRKLDAAMGKVKNKLLVLSGKGGVGKSTVAANLAFALAESGKKVGLLDVDVHGPSIPRLTGLSGQKAFGDVDGIQPLEHSENLKVMSVDFLLESSDQAVIWRGPMKYSAIKQLLSETCWGELDYLVIDAPPGTGDEPLSVAQLVGSNASAVIVTTPQKLALEDVRRCISFCREVSLPIAGVIENMDGLLCPHCNGRINLFGLDGGKQLAQQADVPLLGSIPLDPAVVIGGDMGVAIAQSDTSDETKRAFEFIVKNITEGEHCPKVENVKDKKMKIAIPLAGGKLCMHFGHCEQFALIDVDPDSKKIIGKTFLDPPAHEPGVLPKWLHQQGATNIIAGGMGQRAQQLFTEQNIAVQVGAQSDEPENVVSQFLAGTLQTGENVCDH